MSSTGAPRTSISVTTLTVTVLRVLWIALPASVGVTASDALSSCSHLMRMVTMIGLWACWAVVLTFVLVPTTVSLTVLRMAAPAPFAVAIATVTANPNALGVLAVAHATLVLVVAMSAPIGARYVQGSAYGDEVRLPLRPPAAISLLAAPLSWLIAAAGFVTGPLLLGAQEWIGGAIALVVGWPWCFAIGRRLHMLSRRWLVFVPAGLVVHDPVVLMDSLLVRRTQVTSVGLATVATEASDLTGGATGVAVEIDLREAAPATLRKGRAGTAPITIHAFLVAPSRPGLALREAQRRQLPVG